MLFFMMKNTRKELNYKLIIFKGGVNKGVGGGGRGGGLRGRGRIKSGAGPAVKIGFGACRRSAITYIINS